ncbi:hypothetical protein COV93_01855 [Candidatus Woesearchaeota archaeon CG11_big_fil_rev_8_21_14_0_20_43_8]|nr:MAG: hypothetical protein COV93_01855 [Candidatus Woesearchaeota archaeon CG11_big_fil_rev_8_21_14_0_20_43_8]PIO05563.1 MAG: hypothetical protein COT47_04300 [Candidatus Woesearchaeota archaeon CG08_land_8_20_14_0_20_43_7]
MRSETYEWRTFGCPEIEKEVLLLQPYADRAEHDHYLVVPKRPDINIKERAYELKIKRMIGRCQSGIELWEDSTFDYPIEARMLDGSFPAGEAHSLEELRDLCMGRTIDVYKERHMRLYNHCGFEFDRIWIAGNEYTSICIESDSKERILETIEDFCIGYVPMSYSSFLLGIS